MPAGPAAAQPLMRTRPGLCLALRRDSQEVDVAPGPHDPVGSHASNHLAETFNTNQLKLKIEMWHLTACEVM